jgi:glutaredoxin
MTVTLYGKKGCHLCDVAKAVIERVRGEVPFELEVIDIDQDPALQRRYAWDIPVVLVAGEPFAIHRVDEAAFRRRLAEAAP